MKFLLSAIVIFFFVQNGQSDMIATANMHVDGSEIGIGTILFYQRDPNTPVRVAGIIDSLRSNTVHGFHVHEFPLPMLHLNCTLAGPHFNPFNTSHGPREASIQERHVGDLGNVTANEVGIIVVEIQDSIIDLYDGRRSVANRTLVLHAMRDDGGKGGFPDSKTTGNAGARIACGVISVATEIPSATSNPSKMSNTIRSFFDKIFP